MHFCAGRTFIFYCTGRPLKKRIFNERLSWVAIALLKYDSIILHNLFLVGRPYEIGWTWELNVKNAHLASFHRWPFPFFTYHFNIFYAFPFPYYHLAMSTSASILCSATNRINIKFWTKIYELAEKGWRESMLIYEWYVVPSYEFITRIFNQCLVIFLSLDQ